MALFDTIRAGASGASDYEIARSVRLNHNDSAYFKRTSVSSPTNVKVWTMSLWIKRDGLVNGSDMEILFGNDYNTGSISTRGLQFGVNHSSGINDMQLDVFDGASGNQIARSDGKYRDPTAWLHLVVRCNTPLGTQSSRLRIYVNGEDIGLSNNLSQNQELTWNKGGREQYLGCHAVNGSPMRFYRGYIAEAHFIDGGSKPPESFAETDPVTGFYKPIEYTGTYGNNGWYMAFTDNSNTTATTLGKDYSGNGNNMTPFNFSVSAGRGNDSLEDTPTNNYPTINPINSREPTRISNGNLDIDYTDGDDNVSSVATFAMTSGKYYFEVELRAGSSSVLSSLIGIAPDSYQKLKQNNQNAWPGKDTDSGVGIDGSGAKYVDGNSSTYGNSFTTNDIVGVAVDADAAKVAFSKNGQFSDGNGNYNQGANVASGGQVSIDGTGPYFAVFADTSSSRNPQFSLNFGQRAFSHSIPSGYQKLNSQNLPEPTVPRGDKYFDILQYTGNGSTNTITGLSFSPDWVWTKKVNGTTNHLIYDIVRGTNKSLNSNGTGGQDTSSTNKLTSFNSDGFTIGSNASGNNNGDTFVAWNWDAGESTVTNSSGSISTQVRANTTAGFSICTWTGNGSSGATIGHGLGVTPNFCLIKRTNTGGNNWIAAFFDIQSARELNTSNQFSDGDYDAFFTSQPSSTVATMGTDDNNNNNGSTYVGYFFTNILGYSKFGTYTGNGSSDGSFIFTGFRPRYVMVKRTDSGNHWVIYDTERSTTNVIDEYLRADTSDAQSETSQVDIDFVANGFKFRSGFDIVNAGSGIYFYMAFSENAFKYARAR